MRVLVALLAVVYAVLGMLAGLEAAVASAFSCLDTGPCTYGPDAWQSDVLVALGLASFALVIFAVFIVVGRPRWGPAALGTHGVVLAISLFFAEGASQSSRVLLYGLTLGSGLGLLHARRRLSASSGARDTRAGRYA